MFKRIHAFFHTHYHRHYHGIYKNPKKLFIFDLFLLGTSLIMLGSSLFFFFWKPGTTDLVDLKISLGDTRIKSGEAVKVSVNFTNRNKFELTRPTLAIHLPDGFIVDRSKTPESVFSNNSIVALDTIEPGAKGQAEVYGHLFAEPKTDERILASLSYQAGPDRAVEQKLASYFITLPESILQDTLAIASSSFGKQSVPFTYTLKNTGSTPVNNLGLEDTWNEPLVPENKRKDLTLAPGETIELKGTLTAPTQAGEYTVVIRSYVVANNQKITQSTQQKKLTVIVPELRSEIKLTKPVAFVEPRQELPLEISWKNTNAFALKNVRLKITPTAGLVDLAKTGRENQLKVENGALVIDSSRRTVLGRAEPGATDTLEITLYLLPSFQGSNNAPRLTITPTLEGSTELIEGQVFNESSAPLILALSTDLALNAEVRYFTAEGDQLGRGPLPPEVGNSTKYWVFLELFNTINPTEENALTISLAPGVTFTGKQSVTLGKPLGTSGDGRTLSWQHPEIPPATKTGWYFELESTPTEANIGKNLSLVQGITFTAKDSVVSKAFRLQPGSLTNVLKANDRGSRSASKVIAP